MDHHSKDGGAYRDGQEATLHVIERLEAEVTRREGNLDARTVRFLGDDADRLQRSRQRLQALAEEDAEPLSRVKALERHLALLDEVLARLPALSRVLTAIKPGFPKLEMFARYRPVEQFSRMPVWVGNAFRSVERFVNRFDLDLRAWTLDEPYLRGFKVEFHYRKIPFLLGCERSVDPTTSVAVNAHTVMATTVPRGMPGVAVVPEMLHHTLFLKPLGLVRDMRVRDEQFDREFLVQAAEEEDLEVVNKQARQGLLTLKKTDSPQLLIERGDAAIHWYSEPGHRTLVTAMDVLLALRGTRIKGLE